MYLRDVSVMKTWETKDKIDALGQGEKTVQQYASELKHLWADLDHYSPLTLEGSANILAEKVFGAAPDIQISERLEPAVRAEERQHVTSPSVPFTG